MSKEKGVLFRTVFAAASHAVPLCTPVAFLLRCPHHWTIAHTQYNVIDMSSAWWQYVQRIAGAGTLQKDIAKTAGVDATTITNWATKGTRPRADHVVKFARNYRKSGASVIEALIVAGYLTGDECRQRGCHPDRPVRAERH